MNTFVCAVQYTLRAGYASCWIVGIEVETLKDLRSFLGRFLPKAAYNWSPLNVFLPGSKTEDSLEVEKTAWDMGHFFLGGSI